jgi:hypothetical protein
VIITSTPGHLSVGEVLAVIFVLVVLLHDVDLLLGRLGLDSEANVVKLLSPTVR